MRLWAGWTTGLLALALGLLPAAMAAAVPPSGGLSPERDEFFEARVRPLLVERCGPCHSGTQPQAGLSLQSRAGLLKGGKRGPAVVPGSPERSLLVRAVRAEAGAPKMPPDGALSPEEITVLVEWVRSGAGWPDDRQPTALRPRATAFVPTQVGTPQGGGATRIHPVADRGGPAAPRARLKRPIGVALAIVPTKVDTPQGGGATRIHPVMGHGEPTTPRIELKPPVATTPSPSGATPTTTHWSFRPLQAVTPPAVSGSWVRNPIDQFVLAKLRGHRLHPVRFADRRTLLRRVYFDLTGLPPTPEEAASFLNDTRPDAYPRLIDRLLASPRYGERWGRHWLDVARYADTAGDNADYPVPEARLYRDYVIDAFNVDKPYDRFVQEQLAGDVLAASTPMPPERYAECIAATGFLALSRRYGTAPGELWHLTLEDSIETTGRAFLGLTLRCARCHDHKFDPITREDYYGLYGIFASTRYPYAGSEEFVTKSRPRDGFVPLLPPDQVAPRLASYRAHVEELRKQVAALEQAKPPDAGRLDAARARLREWERAGLPPDLPVAYAVWEGAPVDVPLQVRGDPGNPGPIVKRRLPVFLAGTDQPAIPAGSSGRLELARWLTRPDNPLTARVLVNRVWQWHFGRGIAGTPSNLGVRGEAPTDPALLDWLASQFIAPERAGVQGCEGAGVNGCEGTGLQGEPKGVRTSPVQPYTRSFAQRSPHTHTPVQDFACNWSLKRLHRLIMLSSTYQLAAEDDPADRAADPGNRWHWRFDRQRLDAESLRDSMLSVSGLLDLSRPGSQPFPPMAAWGYTQHYPFRAVYESRHRSVYLMTQRIQRHPFLGLFDAPDANTSTDVRGESTVALQALYFLNNDFVQEQAAAFARRILAASPSPAERLKLGCELAWCRPPTPAERARFLAYLDRYHAELARLGLPPSQQEAEAWTSVTRILLTSNQHVYVD